MAFNINAQIVLSAPKNTARLGKQISSQLQKSTKVNLNFGNTGQISNLSKSLGNINKSITRLNATLASTRSSVAALNSSFSKSAGSVGQVVSAQSKLSSQVIKTNASLKTQSNLLGTLGGRLGSVAKQAVAFGLISRPIYDLQRAFIQATKNAVAFEKEIVKISQVTGQSVGTLSDLKGQINTLATSLGVGANELAETARVIAQTGRTAKETETILKSLARSTLAPTFGKITDTTEGLIAALGQFNLEAQDSEAILGSLNRISKKFAVESEDLISAIRRTGGVFAQAAGQSKDTIGALQELSAIFTAVRSTTRESADTIAAGLRTIFSRIQRRGTIEFLEKFGVQLTDAKGQFIGIFPAFDQLSKKLSVLIKQGDALTLSAIAEELGGIRQIGKLLPAIAQFDKARKALTEAQKGALEGLGGDVAKGLDTIDNRVKRVKESFNELIRTVFEGDSFQNFAKSILGATEGILKFGTKVASVLEPIIPLLVSLGSIKLGGAIGGFIGGGGIGKVTSTVGGVATGQGTQATQTQTQTINKTNNILSNTNSILTRINTQFANLISLVTADNASSNAQTANLIQINNAGFNSLVRQFTTLSTTLATKPSTVPVGGFGGRKYGGGRIYGFNNGGVVPGQGNTDTVPARLTPGEFVIRKSSVQKIGADTLQQLNSGGSVQRFNNGTSGSGARPAGKDFTAKGLKGKQATIDSKTGRKKAAETGKFTAQFDVIPNQVGAFILNPPGSDLQYRSTKKTKFVLPPNNRYAQTFAKQVGLDPKELGAGVNAELNPATYPLFLPSKNDLKAGSVAQSISRASAVGIGKSIDIAVDNLKRSKILDIPPTLNSNEDLVKGAKKNAVNDVGIRSTLEGYIFEGVISAVTGARASGNQANFDFPTSAVSSARDKLTSLFGPLGPLKKADAKRSRDKASGIVNKLTNDIATGKKAGVKLRRKASGGGISGQDTVPALLTPGEFVFNKKAASRIGYGNLNRMNKRGVTGFNKGGAVGVQRFAFGGEPKSGIVDARGSNVDKLLKDEKKAREKNNRELKDNTKNIDKNSDSQKKSNKATEKFGSAFGQLTGAAFSLSFAFSSYKAAVEDGELTFGELANIALLAGPAIGAIAIAAKDAAAGLVSFAAQASTAAKGLAVVGGLALAAGGTLLATGAGGDTGKAVGAGLTAAGSIATLIPLFTGLAAAAPPLAIALTALTAVLAVVVGVVVGAAYAFGTFLANADKVPETLEDLSRRFDQLDKDVKKASLSKVINELNALKKISGDIDLGDRLQSDLTGSLGGLFSFVVDQIYQTFVDGDWEGIGFFAIEALTAGWQSGLAKYLTGTSIGEFIAQRLGIDTDEVQRRSKTRSAFSPARIARLSAEQAKQFEQESKVTAKAINKAFGELDEAARQSADGFVQTARGIGSDIKFESQFDFLGGGEIQELEKRLNALGQVYEASGVENGLEQARKDFQKGIQASLGNVAQLIKQNSDKLREAGVDGLKQAELLKKISTAQTPQELAAAINELQAIFKAAGIEFDVAASLIDPSLGTIIDQFDSGLPQALELTTKKIEKFTSVISQLGDSLDATFDRISNRFDSLGKDIDNALAGKSDVNIGQVADAFAPGTDIATRQAGIDAIGRATGQDVSELKRLDNAFQSLEGFANQFVENVRSGQTEFNTPQDFVSDFEKQFGPLPEKVSNAISQNIADSLASRQGSGGDLTSSLEDLLDEEDFAGAITSGAIEPFNEGLRKGSEAINKQLELLEASVNQQLKINQAVIQANLNELKLRQKYEDQNRKILGIQGNNFARTQTGLRDRLTAVGASPDASIGSLAAERENILTRRSNLIDDVRNQRVPLESAQTELDALTTNLESNTEAMKILSDRTQELAAIEQDIAEEQRKRAQAEKGLDEIIDAVASGDRDAQIELTNRLGSLQRVFGGGGTVQDALSARKTLGSDLGRSLAEVFGGPSFAGNLGTVLTRQLGGLVASGGGLIGNAAFALLQQSYRSQIRGNQLYSDLNDIQKQELAATQQLNDQNINLAQDIQDTQVPKTFEEATTAFGQYVQDFNEAIGKLNNNTSGGDASEFNRGGVVYRAAGGAVTGSAGAGAAAAKLGSQLGVNFAPKGTDTVPAMLTPGEFVIKKSAVQKIGMGNLQALNNGRSPSAFSRGGAVYLQDAGQVPNRNLAPNIDPIQLYKDVIAYEKQNPRIDSNGDAVDSSPIDIWNALVEQPRYQQFAYGSERFEDDPLAKYILALQKTRAKGLFNKYKKEYKDNNINVTRAMIDAYDAESLAAFDAAVKPVNPPGTSAPKPGSEEAAQAALAQTFPEGIPAPGSRNGDTGTASEALDSTRRTQGAGRIARTNEAAQVQKQTEKIARSPAELDLMQTFNALVIKGINNARMGRNPKALGRGWTKAKDILAGNIGRLLQTGEITPEDRDRIVNEVDAATRRLGIPYNFTSTVPKGFTSSGGGTFLTGADGTGLPNDIISVSKRSQAAGKRLGNAKQSRRKAAGGVIYRAGGGCVGGGCGKGVLYRPNGGPVPPVGSAAYFDYQRKQKKNKKFTVGGIGGIPVASFDTPQEAEQYLKNQQGLGLQRIQEEQQNRKFNEQRQRKLDARRNERLQGLAEIEKRRAGTPTQQQPKSTGAGAYSEENSFLVRGLNFLGDQKAKADQVIGGTANIAGVTAARGAGGLTSGVGSFVGGFVGGKEYEGTGPFGAGIRFAQRQSSAPIEYGRGLGQELKEGLNQPIAVDRTGTQTQAPTTTPTATPQTGVDTFPQSFPSQIDPLNPGGIPTQTPTAPSSQRSVSPNVTNYLIGLARQRGEDPQDLITQYTNNASYKQQVDAAIAKGQAVRAPGSPATGGGRPSAVERARAANVVGPGSGNVPTQTQSPTQIEIPYQRGPGTASNLGDPNISARDAALNTFPGGIPAPGSRSGGATGTTSEAPSSESAYLTSSSPESKELQKATEPAGCGPYPWQESFNSLVLKGIYRAKFKGKNPKAFGSGWGRARDVLANGMRGESPECVKKVKQQILDAQQRLGISKSYYDFGSVLREGGSISGSLIGAERSKIAERKLDRATPVRRAGGGEIPAMLTPGEFVMNANAVQRNGINFMESLNNGQIQRYHSGGLVYKQGGGGVTQGGGNNGGSMSLDPTELVNGLMEALQKGGEKLSEKLNSALGQANDRLDQSSSKLAAFPEKTSVEIAPVQIVGTDSIGNAIAEQLYSKLAPLLQKQYSADNSPPASQGGGVQSPS